MAQDYAPRIVDTELAELLSGLPAISLEGPRGVGKTETARRLARTRHELDRPGAVEVAASDPDRLVEGAEPILIDEWQRWAPSWDLVRRAVDEDRRPGRFLLTGSASAPIAGAHTGAGRIVTVRMRPMSLAERGLAEPAVSLAELLTGGRPPVSGSTEVRLGGYVEEILAGGFPGVRTAPSRTRRAELDGYLERIISREFPEQGLRVRNPAVLRRWLRAYAAATSTITSYDRIRDASSAADGDKPARTTTRGGAHLVAGQGRAADGDKPARTTTRPYRDILEQLRILDPLEAWLPIGGHLSRLTVGPKHHLADPALAARLLGVDAGALLDARPTGPTIVRDGTLLGALFESLVTQSVRVYAQASEAATNHLRTRGGDLEVDVIVVRPDQRVVAVEVKLAASIGDRDVGHLNRLAARLGADLLDAVIVTTGRDAYRRRDGIAVVPAALLGP